MPVLYSNTLLGPARSLLGPAHSNKGTLGVLDSGEHSRIAFRQLQQATTPLCSERDGCSAINDAGTTRRCEYIRRRWCLKGSQQYRLQGRIQGFPKGGFETRDTKCWGGGGGGGGGGW